MLRVREICKEKKISLTSLAEKLGIARSQIYKIIDGNPTLSTMQAVADALGVSVCDLLEDPRERFR